MTLHALKVVCTVSSSSPPFAEELEGVVLAARFFFERMEFFLSASLALTFHLAPSPAPCGRIAVSKKPPTEKDVLDGLSPTLRAEVVQHLVRNTLGTISFFQRALDPEFLVDAVPAT